MTRVQSLQTLFAIGSSKTPSRSIGNSGSNPSVASTTCACIYYPATFILLTCGTLPTSSAPRINTLRMPRVTPGNGPD